MKTLLLIMFCIVFATCLLDAQTIKQAEYFIDKDKGVGKNTKLDLGASADSSYQINIDVSGINPGYHKLYIRIKDSKGRWGLTSQKNIEVTNTFTQAKIILGEYFFDADPGYGKGKKIFVSLHDTAILQSFAVGTSALKTGYHKLYMRFKDSLGNWSGTSRRSVEIIKTADTIKIVAAEYFFNTDKGYGKATGKIFSEAAEDGKFKFKIPYNKIPAGATTLFVRVKDSLSKWSFTKVDTFSVATLQNTFALTNEDSNRIGANKLSIFPNPASQHINVQFQSRSRQASIQIVDINGKTVMQTTMQGVSKNIDISKLVPGSYLLQLKDGNETQTTKFIKQ